MYIISISHKTAPISIREVFSFSAEEQEAFIKAALASEHISQCVVVSTCNRSELYFDGDAQSIQVMEQKLADFKKVKLEDLMKYFLVYCDEKAYRHLFQVTCGFDSMVVGEDEILGQVKEAYERALALRATKYTLNTSFQAAITCAKKIKTDTKLSKTPISIGTLVVNEITQFPKEEKKVFIIGLTGKMGTIIMKNLYKKKNITIIGTARSHNSIQEIALDYRNVKIVAYKDRYHYMNEADIIISATTSPHYTITYQELAPMLPTDKTRIFIDLAVPRDIDKEITRLQKVSLFDIDYFDRVAKNNIQLKEQETERARYILEEQLEELLKTLSFHDFLPELNHIKRLFEEKGFEQAMYEIRNKASHAELQTVLKVLRELAE